jgi:Tfp pilus assembly protein PilE
VKNAGGKIRFTLVELIVSMAVFAILMLIIMSFFDSAQRVWTESFSKSTAYENARIAFDLIERDLQCIYYEHDKTPFWHKADTSSLTPSWTVYKNQMLAFVSETPVTPNGLCESNLYEIKYQLYFADSHNDQNDGWIMRSATGDRTDDNSNNVYDASSNPSGKWNFNENFNVGLGGVTKAFTGNADSSSPSLSSIPSNPDFSRYDYEKMKIIPCVTALTFVCYRLDGTTVNPDTTGNTPTEFPYSVKVEITLMSKSSFQKWQVLDTGAAPNAGQFKSDHERKFTKTFLVGERGQYD